MPHQPATDSIYQIKVTLEGAELPIWRRIQVPAYATLHQLHLILQVVMGWTNSHLYQFKARGAYYGELNRDYYLDDIAMKDAKRFKLNQVVHGEKAKFIYEYDFGDNWEHEVLIESVLPVEPGVSYPICIAGERACPPEDCGGIWGYADYLEIIQHPEHEEYEEMREWLGEDFDPEAFDVSQVNRLLSPSTRNREYTHKQGQYLAFIQAYSELNGYPPSEAEMQRYFRVTPPTVHQMVLKLEKEGFIERVPRKPRSIRVLVPPEELPALK